MPSAADHRGSGYCPALYRPDAGGIYSGMHVGLGGKNKY